jgi:FlaA1/EpsC-like NDP-sugar epimerase
MPDLSPGSSARFRVAEQINRILTAVVAALSERSTHARLRTIWTTDLVLCVIATWIAFGLRIGVPYVPIWPFTATVALSFFAWSVFSQTSGFYRIVLRSAGGQAMVDLAKIGGLMILSMTAAIVLLAIPNLPRTLGVLQPVTFIGLVGISRLIIRFLLIDFTPRTGFANAKRILIYGAGRAGQQLALSMRHELHLQIVGFYDDNPALHGATIDGRTVFDHTQLIALLSADDLDEILIALPSASRQRRREIVEELQAYPVPVRVLPSAADIISGSVTLSDLRDVQIEDLLGRDPIPPKADLMARQIFQ